MTAEKRKLSFLFFSFWQKVQPVHDKLGTLLMVVPDCQNQQTVRHLHDKWGVLPVAIPDALGRQTVLG